MKLATLKNRVSNLRKAVVKELVVLIKAHGEKSFPDGKKGGRIIYEVNCRDLGYTPILYYDARTRTFRVAVHIVSVDSLDNELTIFCKEEGEHEEEGDTLTTSPEDFALDELVSMLTELASNLK
jgi:hypothetical protein